MNKNIFLSVVSPYTMTTEERINLLYDSLEYIRFNKIKGDFVECGVWKGGNILGIIEYLEYYKMYDCKVWLYDTFQGMTSPTMHDCDRNNIHADDGEYGTNKCFSSLDEVKSIISKSSFPQENIKYVIGDINITLDDKENVPNDIALLRLDTDWYESTKKELHILYPNLVHNGVLIIDDYGDWQGCKKAVDDYFNLINKDPKFEFIGHTAIRHIKKKRKNDLIYTAFYTNLKSYDGDDIDREFRFKTLDYCIKSFKLCNPNLNFKIDIIDTPIENTCEMYFDKMIRIKNLNKNYNVLWIDNDTICLQNIEEIFESENMKGVFWGWWDGFNALNGGVIYYPQKYLYDNFDLFTKYWIKMLNTNKNFIGPYEQFPISDLFKNQFSEQNHNLYDNFENLINLNFLLPYEYNSNPFIIPIMNKNFNIYSNDNNILYKKILHLNSSVLYMKDISLHISDYVLNNLLYFTQNKDDLITQCDKFMLSNKYVNITIENNNVTIKNNSLSILKLIDIKNVEDLSNVNRNDFFSNDIIKPGYFISKYKHENSILILFNIFSGEIEIL